MKLSRADPGVTSGPPSLGVVCCPAPMYCSLLEAGLTCEVSGDPVSKPLPVVD